MQKVKSKEVTDIVLSYFLDKYKIWEGLIGLTYKLMIVQ